ncbi:Zn(2)-C6 fungal-type DNA-binding domain [Phaffia rhodozyma]|uniref:Zn(2)-C6 fungal-type DNA-binding domain n=1 Tax=Phaffia rhodozyma TaxID=264483 RepID=A0A0F7SXT6_PHARH|nr:Zn(2)-C6 fungal-type DNA-binding domain [Phaffia rhodozyma]
MSTSTSDSTASSSALDSASSSALTIADSSAKISKTKRSQKFKRSRTGCLQCRKAKHKCDEQKPICIRCKTNSKECAWPVDAVTELRGYVISSSAVFPSASSSSDTAHQIPLGSTDSLPTTQYNFLAVSSSTTPTVSVNAASNDFSALNSHSVSSVSADYPSNLSASSWLGVSAEPSWTVRRSNMDAPTISPEPSSTTKPQKTLEEALEYCFPDQEERELMKHFLENTAGLSQTIPVPHLPLFYLEPSQLIASPRGLSIPSDALLFALLSIAAVHKSSLYTIKIKEENARDTNADDFATFSIDDMTTASLHHPSTISRLQSSQSKLLSLASSLLQTSHALLQSSLALSTAPSDILIATSVTLVLSSVLMASKQWRVNFECAKMLIARRGGPRAMLDEARSKIDRNEDSPAWLMRCRSMLEHVVIFEVFHSIGTGEFPQFLNEPFCPWWFDFVGNVSRTEVFGPETNIASHVLDHEQGQADWETIETNIGVSRGMIELIARVNVLTSQTLYAHELPLYASPSSFPPAPRTLREQVERANELLLELGIWREEITNSMPSAGTTNANDGRGLGGRGGLESFSRVEFGNAIYALTMEIIISIDVLGIPHLDPSVQRAAYTGLELLVKSNVTNGQVIALMWPAIVCGGMMTDKMGRTTTRAVIEYYRNSCCFDVDAALAVVENLWARKDAGEVNASWREYQRQSGLILV